MSELIERLSGLPEGPWSCHSWEESNTWYIKDKNGNQVIAEIPSEKLARVIAGIPEDAVRIRELEGRDRDLAPLPPVLIGHEEGPAGATYTVYRAMNLAERAAWSNGFDLAKREAAARFSELEAQLFASRDALQGTIQRAVRAEAERDDAAMRYRKELDRTIAIEAETIERCAEEVDPFWPAAAKSIRALKPSGETQSEKPINPYLLGGSSTQSEG